MVDLAVVANALTIAVTLVAVASGLLSWLRKGTVHKFYTLFNKVDTIESEVKEVHDWTGNVEVILVELAREDTEVTPEGVRDLLDIEEARAVIVRGVNGDSDNNQDNAEGSPSD